MKYMYKIIFCILQYDFAYAIIALVAKSVKNSKPQTNIPSQTQPVRGFTLGLDLQYRKTCGMFYLSGIRKKSHRDNVSSQIVNRKGVVTWI